MREWEDKKEGRGGSERDGESERGRRDGKKEGRMDRR